jgi:hypothetical protein
VNRQLHCIRYLKRNDKIKAIESNGHAIPLVNRQGPPEKIDVYWRLGRENLGDYHTKHHSAQHHKDMRHLILHEANSLQVLRG